MVERTGSGSATGSPVRSEEGVVNPRRTRSMKLAELSSRRTHFSRTRLQPTVKRLPSVARPLTGAKVVTSSTSVALNSVAGALTGETNWNC